MAAPHQAGNAVAAIVAAVGGSAVGAVVTAVFTGRDQRRKRARRRYRDLDRRLRANEQETAGQRAELRALGKELDAIERKEPG